MTKLINKEDWKKLRGSLSAEQQWKADKQLYKLHRDFHNYLYSNKIEFKDVDKEEFTKNVIEAINQGADIDASPRGGSYFFDAETYEAVKYYVENFNADIFATPDDYSALHTFATAHDIAGLKYCKEMGVDINHLSQGKLNVLDFACGLYVRHDGDKYNKEIEVAKFFIENGGIVTDHNIIGMIISGSKALALPGMKEKYEEVAEKIGKKIELRLDRKDLMDMNECEKTLNDIMNLFGNAVTIDAELLGKIIKNYNTGNSAENWGNIHILNKDIGKGRSNLAVPYEIKDTIDETSKYISYYMIAEGFRKAERSGDLRNISSKELSELTDEVRNKLSRYFLGNKTMPQIAKMATEWHKVRAVLTSSDGRGLRDFTEKGNWHQITDKKEIKVTKTGLTGYSLTSLTSPEELDEEGKALKHCVSSKVEECKERGLHIFSIKKNNERLTTLGITFDSENSPQIWQHYGFDDRAPTSEEKEVADWFLESIKNKKVKIDLSKTGVIPLSEIGLSEFENRTGILLKDLTPERLQHNLDMITSVNRSKIYILGKENNKTNAETLAKNMGLDNLQKTLEKMGRKKAPDTKTKVIDIKKKSLLFWRSA